MTQQPFQSYGGRPQAKPESLPTPPTGSTSPPTTGAAAPEVEAQFLVNVLGTLLDSAGPIALKWLRDRLSSMGVSAQDEGAVAQAVDDFQAQFLGFLAPFIPIAIDVIGRIIQGATSGQAAGEPGTETAGTVAQQYSR